MVSDEYTPTEKKSFYLHTAFAIACLPFYFFIPTLFGLLISPYLFFLAIRPRPQYLLPVIIHIAYGSQQRSFFCLGCFLYVLCHFNELRRYSLMMFYVIYLALFPFFIWYFIQKLNGPRYVGGIGEVTGGLGEYLVFSVSFWGCLAIKKVNRDFIRGLLWWSLFLLVVVSFRSANTYLEAAESDAVGGMQLFSREVFFAIPFLIGSFYWFSVKNRQGLCPEGLISGFGSLLFVLDFLKVLKYPTTFTQFGMCVLTCLILYLSTRAKGVLLVKISPIIFFLISFAVVLSSARIVEKYGGLYADKGTYDEMEIKDIESFFTKMQRKAVDDRASVWNMNLQHITSMLRSNPIFVDTSPVIRGKIFHNGEFIDWETDMGAHNTLLQLLRTYGFYGGLGLYILFILFYCKRNNRLFIVKNKSSPAVVLMAVCLSEGIIGGHTGHFPVQLTFGPVIFSCMGACWRKFYEEDQIRQVIRYEREMFGT